MSTSTSLPQLTLGISAGDLVDVVRREIKTTLKQARGNRVRAARLSLKRLYESGLITSRDLQSLGKVTSAIFAAETGKLAPDKAADKLDQIYQEMLMDARSSRVAITMAGVVYSKKQDEQIGVLGFFGLLLGGLLGGAIGGEAGASIGALVGAFAGGWLATQCEDE